MEDLAADTDWSYITANKGFTKRVLNYISFMISAVIASLWVKKVDIVVGTSPQLFTACAAYIAGKMKRVPWIFELRDIWPESIRAVEAMNHSFILDWLETIELFLYRKASVVVSVTRKFKENLVNRGIEETKIHVVTNGVDLSRFSPRGKDAELVAKYHLEDKFVAGYIGTHGMAHALDTVLEAARELKNHPQGERYPIILLGNGANKKNLLDRAGKEGLDNVIFIDSVCKDEVVRYWSLLDVFIIHLKKTELFTTVIPSKLFECMAMAIPVLHGVRGESADIVEGEDIGITFEPENSRELCNGLMQLANDKVLFQRLKRNGPKAAKEYDRRKLAAKMMKIIESLD